MKCSIQIHASMLYTCIYTCILVIYICLPANDKNLGKCLLFKHANFILVCLLQFVAVFSSTIPTQHYNTFQLYIRFTQSYVTFMSHITKHASVSSPCLHNPWRRLRDKEHVCAGGGPRMSRSLTLLLLPLPPCSLHPGISFNYPIHALPTVARDGLSCGKQTSVLTWKKNASTPKGPKGL